MTVKDLEGTYNITGENQNSEGNQYTGTLTLSLDTHNRIEAKWLINNTQEQFGYGFYKNNILVINFNYKGLDNQVFKGVVVYKCITKDILEGFWSEKHGDLDYLGEEQCLKIKTISTLN